MNQQSATLSFEMNADPAVALVVATLARAGLEVKRSFDLQVARATHVGCTCPHHGTEQCSCQMVVLLVYGTGLEPASLVAHARDGVTEFTLADLPESPRHQDLELRIRRALLEARLMGLDQKAQDGD